jgi:hypothetical protein
MIGFSAKFNCDKLVYYEAIINGYKMPIAREKQLKGRIKTEED